MPKCITHTAGAVLLNNRKEGNLHRDVSAHDPDDLCTLQYTTTGWIMYLSSCLSLVGGSRCILYDGSPFQPDLTAFIKLWGDQGVTDLGLSPRYFQTLATAKPPINPRDVTDLSKLRRVTSTGMVLSEVQFEWFYDQAFPPRVQLANIAGGTDTAACFTMDTLMKPLYVGGTMTPALGMKVEIFDQEVEGGRGVKGRPLPAGEQGELVCTRGFPTQPSFFWGDPSGERYFKAYYERFDGKSTDLYEKSAGFPPALFPSMRIHASFTMPQLTHPTPQTSGPTATSSPPTPRPGKSSSMAAQTACSTPRASASAARKSTTPSTPRSARRSRTASASANDDLKIWMRRCCCSCS